MMANLRRVSAPNDEIEQVSTRFASYGFICLTSVAVAVAIYQTVLATSRYIRTLLCLNKEKQNYFSHPMRYYALFKEHLLYAPLIRTRHHQEIRLFRGWGVGILPTRFQSILLMGIAAMNVTFCVKATYTNGTLRRLTMKDLGKQCGTLAVANMIPLVLTAGRSNPLIPLLGVSYDSFNLMHRWFGRICMALAIVHMSTYLVIGTAGDPAALIALVFGGPVPVAAGVIALTSFIVINIQSMAMIRHAFYEFFLHVHIALVIAVLIALWRHLVARPTQKIYLYIVTGLWAADRAVRLLRLVYRNIGGRGVTCATVQALPGDAVRVTLKLARPWNFRPGQYFFVTIPSVGLWTSHPFSAAWSEKFTVLTDDDGIAITNQDILARRQSMAISAVIRHRAGFTHQLFKKVTAAEDGIAKFSAIVEGPYGLTTSLSSYGTVILFAGGVGISHQLPYIRYLVTGYANGTLAVRRVCLIWVIQCLEHFEWVRPWITYIFSLDSRPEVLRIQLYVTRHTAKEIQPPSLDIETFCGRPNVDTLIGKEVEVQAGAVVVSVCGTGGMADDVRRAVRKRQGVSNIDLVEESFSW